MLAVVTSGLIATSTLYGNSQEGDLDLGRPVTRDPGFPKLPCPLHLLPQDKGDESPAALDGSPYGLYFSPSTSGSKKWTISINGGGWCYDEATCYSRSKGSLGSSTGLAREDWCLCSNMNEAGDDYEHDCNCVRLPYLDGASFSGYRAKPWPVPGGNETVRLCGITFVIPLICDFNRSTFAGSRTSMQPSILQWHKAWLR